jgi:hypothetical protein
MGQLLAKRAVVVVVVKDKGHAVNSGQRYVIRIPVDEPANHKYSRIGISDFIRFWASQWKS